LKIVCLTESLPVSNCTDKNKASQSLVVTVLQYTYSLQFKFNISKREQQIKEIFIGSASIFDVFVMEYLYCKIHAFKIPLDGFKIP